MGGALLAVLAAALFIRLGVWQLDRHDQRRSLAAAVAEAGAAAPVDLAAALRTAGDAADLEYRTVRLTGSFTTGDTVALVNRSFRGTSGFEVLDPFQLAGGGTVVVNRGFVALPALAEGPIPAPPGGEVTLEGRARLSREGARLSTATGGAVTARITRPDLARLADHWRRPLAPVYVEFIESAPPRAADAPIPVDPPQVGAGPHFGYAFQWFAFAGIALVGFAVLAHRTARGPAGGTRPPGSVRYRRTSLPGSRQ